MRHKLSCYVNMQDLQICDDAALIKLFCFGHYPYSYFLADATCRRLDSASVLM